MAQQAKLQAEMQAAGQKIAAQMEQAHRDAEALKEQIQAAGKAEVQREKERAHREIETAKDQALKEIWEQTVSLAALLSAKTIKRELSAQDHRRLLDESLAEMKAAGLPKRI